MLTDDGIQFRFAPRCADGATARYTAHMFGMQCRVNGIWHGSTQANHAWTDGQVERMNRTIREAAVKRFHYDSRDQLRRSLDVLTAYNLPRRLKRLRSLMPYGLTC
jgi:hypothetical protein